MMINSSQCVVDLAGLDISMIINSSQCVVDSVVSSGDFMRTCGSCKILSSPACACALSCEPLRADRRGSFLEGILSKDSGYVYYLGIAAFFIGIPTLSS